MDNEKINAETKKYDLDLSIVIPLFNEEESLEILFNKIKEVCQRENLTYEVLFINDGSKDDSLEVLKKLQNENPKEISIFSFYRNYGKAAALQVGFNNAEGEFVITMDADLQDDPEEIPDLISKLKEGFDLVSGWKKVRHDPISKRLPSKFFNYVTSIAAGVRLHDFNCGLKAYRNIVVKNVQLYGELHRYIPMMAHWQGFRVTEKIVQHHPRKFGVSKYGVRRFFSGFFDLMTVIATQRYIKKPLHLFGMLGLLFFGAGVLINLYLTIVWIAGHGIGTRPLLFLGVLLTIVGIQFISTGILGEMFIKHFADSKEYKHSAFEKER